MARTIRERMNVRDNEVFTPVDLINARTCLLYTSDAADERSSVDLGGRRIIKKKNNAQCREATHAERKIEKQL